MSIGYPIGKLIMRMHEETKGVSVLKSMEEIENPLINWLKGCGDIEFNLASSSVRANKLREECTIKHGLELSDDHGRAQKELMNKILSYYPDTVKGMMTFGAQSANHLASLVLKDDQSHALLEDPTYMQLFNILSSLDYDLGIFRRSYQEEFNISLKNLDNKVHERTRLVAITNPHNPSGVYLPTEKLKKVQEYLEKRGIYLLVDEIFREFIPDSKSAVTLGDNVIVTSSLSKVYGMGGLRIGWAISSNEELVEIMKSAKYSSLTPNSVITQKIAKCELDNREELLNSAIQTSVEGKAVVKKWIDDSRFIDWTEPDGGIISFPKLKIKSNTYKFANSAKQQGVLLSPGTFFSKTDNFDKHIRLTFRERPERIRQALQILTHLLQEYG